MQLFVKNMNISTGDVCIALLYKKTARTLALHPGDRIRISSDHKYIIAVLDITASINVVGKNQIGLFEEALKKLGVKEGDKVTIALERKPRSLLYIREKLDGIELSYNKIRTIISDITRSKLTDIEMSYFVAASYINKLSMTETIALTKAMINVGNKLKLRGMVVDKHCIGGVAGNRTTMVIVPIVSSTGIKMPKTSSRAISSAAGTADTMEVLARVNVSFDKMKEILRTAGACIVWTGNMNLAAADDKLIKIRHPLSLDPLGMMLASVMAKKGAVSSKKLLIDIPYGKGAKVQDKNEALFLKDKFIFLGKRLGIDTKVILTDGSAPIGNGIGPVLEARDVMRVLRNSPRKPKDLYNKAIMMSAILLHMSKKARTLAEAKKLAEKLIVTGKAYDQMMRIIKAQGGSTNTSIIKRKLKLAKFSHDIKAHKRGKILLINNKFINYIARTAGSPTDKAAGILLHKHKGQYVKRGEVLYTIYAQSKIKLEYAIEAASRMKPFIIK